MAAFRFLASLFLLAAIVALVSDLTPVDNEPAGLHVTALQDHWAAIAPATLESVRKSAGTIGWDYFLGPLLAVPTFMFFGIFALICGYVGRRRHRVDVFIN